MSVPSSSSGCHPLGTSQHLLSLLTAPQVVSIQRTGKPLQTHLLALQLGKYVPFEPQFTHLYNRRLLEDITKRTQQNLGKEFSSQKKKEFSSQMHELING